MLSFNALFESLVLLVALRLSGLVAWGFKNNPWLRILTPWLCMSVTELHEWAIYMRERYSAEEERSRLVLTERSALTRGPAWSVSTEEVLTWLRKL